MGVVLEFKRRKKNEMNCERCGISTSQLTVTVKGQFYCVECDKISDRAIAVAEMDNEFQLPEITTE